MRLHELSVVLLNWLWETGIQAALLAGVVGCVIGLLRQRISPAARQALWLLVFLRLVMPVLPGSRFSIWSLYTRPQIKTEQIQIQQVHYSSGPQPVSVAERSVTRSLLAPIPPSIFDHPQIWLAILWVAGAMVIFGYTVVSTFRFARAIQRTSRTPDANITNIINECCQHARMKHVRAVLSDKVATPALFGVFQPTLLLPPAVVSTLDTHSLRNVILHELEHLKRHHLAMDWLLTAIRAVHWFNPAAWWAHRQVRAARELICDQAVIVSLANVDAARHYGHTLLTIASSALRSNEPALVAAFARDHRLLKERIETIARFGKRKYITGLGVALAAVLIAGFLTGPIKGQEAQSHAVPTTAPTTSMAENILKYPDHWPPVTQTKDKAADEAVRAALDQKLPEVRLDNVAFADVVEFLRDMSGQAIYINWKALADAGIDRNTLVSARIKEVEFFKVLDIILNDLGRGKAKITYTVDEGVITVSTAQDLDSNVMTRVYDVRDLVAVGFPNDPKQLQELTNQIIQLIENTISPDYWIDRGGKTAKIRQLPGTTQLIVTQTPENHQKLTALLDQLRETRAVRIRLDAKILEIPIKIAEQMEEHLNPEATVFLTDVGVSGLIQTPGIRMIGAPALLTFNGQEAVINMGGDGESFSLRHQATISQDRKYVILTPSMIYSPNSTISAEERRQFLDVTTKQIEAELYLTQRKLGDKNISAASAQTIKQRQEELTQAIEQAKQDAAIRFSAGKDIGQTWSSPPQTVSVADGETLLIKKLKHSIFQLQRDNSLEPTNAPLGDKVIWLLLRPTIVLQREKEQTQTSPPQK